MAVLIIQDLVSRKWITEVVSAEETSTQVEVGFTDALEIERLLDAVQARLDNGCVDPGVDDEARPILLAVSDNGPQMTSGSTREFMALCAIAQHFGRPGTDRSGVGGELQRSPQGRVPAPAGHRGPGHPTRRTRRNPGALEFGQVARRHRIRDSERRTRRTRRSDPQSPTGRARTSP